MVTLQNADSALKTIYLGVVSEQLNTSINPFLAAIEKTTRDVWGKEVRKLIPFGINGGIGAGTETGDLPMASANNYTQFTSTLKNLYGNIEISDKAMRASQNSAGAFVDLLNSEMQGLISAAKFNFGRMLYGDGQGVLGEVVNGSNGSAKVFTVDKIRNFMEGMVVDCYDAGSLLTDANRAKKIVVVDRALKKITLDSEITGDFTSGFFTIQNSRNQELTGLGSIFGNLPILYGVTKSLNKWINPHIKSNVGTISDTVIQEAIDRMDEQSCSKANFIICSNGVKRAYQNYLQTYKRNIDVMDLKGGYKAISYNGIPLISDRFVSDGTMFILNTDDFALHQLCDWKWLEGENGKVIKQIAGKPAYSATLVKYADLMCDRPGGQAMLQGITEA